jgi:hypothetical protein
LKQDRRADTETEKLTMNITEYAGEPRILDLDLAAGLGFLEPRAIHRLVDRHGDALARFGDIPVTVTQNTDPLGRGRPGKAYLLNRKQALYICAKSETPRAAEVTIQMVEVFDRYLEGKTVHVDEHWRRAPRPKALPEPQQCAADIKCVTISTDNPRIARALLAAYALALNEQPTLALR